LDDVKRFPEWVLFMFAMTRAQWRWTNLRQEILGSHFSLEYQLDEIKVGCFREWVKFGDFLSYKRYITYN
jgi:hypothetical protein